MMNRRKFVTAVAASAAMLARILNVFAQTYQLIIGKRIEFHEVRPHSALKH